MPVNLPLRCLFLLLVVSASLPTVAEESKSDPKESSVAIFNGKDLTGWEGNTDLWSVKDGTIVGDSPGIKHNDFLATTKRYSDFDLTLEFRMTSESGKGNSGIQFRSERVPDSTAIVGYQADMGQKYWGCLYDEHRRRKILHPAPETLKDVLKPAGWNTYRIRAKGPKIEQWINDLKTVDYTEADPKIPADGIIALQLHSGPKLKMEFRKIRIRDLSSED